MPIERTPNQNPTKSSGKGRRTERAMDATCEGGNQLPISIIGLEPRDDNEIRRRRRQTCGESARCKFIFEATTKPPALMLEVQFFISG